MFRPEGSQWKRRDLFMFELVQDSHSVGSMEGSPRFYGNPPGIEVGMKLGDSAEGEDSSHSREGQSEYIQLFVLRT
ncbi:hypothetical protein TB1_006564 [Malus domestica]